MSGLNILNAHPRLYWGQWGFDRARRLADPASAFRLDDDPAALQPRRRAAVALAVRVGLRASGCWSFMVRLADQPPLHPRPRHPPQRMALERDLGGRRSSTCSSISSTAGSKFNFLQKFAYGLVIFIVLPLMIFTGMAMSPGMDANWPFLHRPVRRPAERALDPLHRRLGAGRVLRAAHRAGAAVGPAQADARHDHRRGKRNEAARLPRGPRRARSLRAARRLPEAARSLRCSTNAEELESQPP